MEPYGNNTAILTTVLLAPPRTGPFLNSFSSHLPMKLVYKLAEASSKHTLKVFVHVAISSNASFFDGDKMVSAMLVKTALFVCHLFLLMSAVEKARTLPCTYGEHFIVLYLVV